MSEVQSYARSQFREVVRHPQAHAVILGQYRVGEYAGVVGLRRLLGEMDPETKLRRTMEIHHRDEARHTQVFTDWMRRLEVAPPALPEDVEGFFARTPEEYHRHRDLLAQMSPEVRRLFVFAAINAVERLAYAQFETHLSVLDRAEDRELLEGVMAEEKFHLSYVEAELDRQAHGPNGALVAAAVEGARTRFADFQELRRAEARQTIERLLG